MSRNSSIALESVWIDMTDMLFWRGSFTGIQRVTYEYATRFSKDGANLCAYDKSGDRFFKIDINFIDDIIRNKSNNNTEPVTLRRRIRLFIGRPYYALPDGAKKTLRPLLKHVNHLARLVISRMMSVKKGGSRGFYDSFPEAEFVLGDTVLILGAGWNEPACFNKLSALKKNTNIKIVHHVNDILPIYQPQLFSDELPKIFTPYIKNVIENSDKITVISDATKRDIEAYCSDLKINIPIEVVTLGDDIKPVKAIRPKPLVGIDNFILAVGTFEVRKNYILIYQALKLAQLEGRDVPRVVIAGRRGWLTNDLTYIISNDPFMANQLVWIDDVSDSELEWLYSNCMFTIFTSLAEGWGLPVAESLCHGKFSLISGVSSMLEIGVGFVDYFLPYDARELLEKIQYYVFENRYLESNKHIQKSYKISTWDYSYAQLKKALIKS